MNFLHNLSDDQTALIGCAAALAAAGLMMSISYYLGRWNETAQPVAHRLPQRQHGADRSGKAA
ncbi:MAG: hypothetical protein AB7U20_25515 [Planctomycetaceae bacterium]